MCGIAIQPKLVHGCSGKAVFADMATAAERARRIRKRSSEAVEAYHCRHCHRYHVGGLRERGDELRSRDRKRHLSDIRAQEVTRT